MLECRRRHGSQDIWTEPLRRTVCLTMDRSSAVWHRSRERPDDAERPPDLSRPEPRLIEKALINKTF